MRVLFTIEAGADFISLPVKMQGRVCVVVTRLADWPATPGAKPLRGALHGHYRIRTGDWRVIFYIAINDAAVVITRIAHRSTVYED